MKPGLIGRLIISYRIGKLTEKEVILTTELKEKLEFKSMNHQLNMAALDRADKLMDEIKVLQDKKKKLYLKFL